MAGRSFQVIVIVSLVEVALTSSCRPDLSQSAVMASTSFTHLSHGETKRSALALHLRGLRTPIPTPSRRPRPASRSTATLRSDLDSLTRPGQPAGPSIAFTVGRCSVHGAAGL